MEQRIRVTQGRTKEACLAPRAIGGLCGTHTYSRAHPRPVSADVTQCGWPVMIAFCDVCRAAGLCPAETQVVLGKLEIRWERRRRVGEEPEDLGWHPLPHRPSCPPAFPTELAPAELALALLDRCL